jgi:hypothetical protein
MIRQHTNRATQAQVKVGLNTKNPFKVKIEPNYKEKYRSDLFDKLIKNGFRNCCKKQ